MITALLALALAASPAAPAPTGGTADLVVLHGTVVTVDPNHRVLPDGAVYVKDGRIVAISASGKLSAWTAKETLDAGGGIVMPGLINAHGHAAMVLLRGVADDLKLMDWLQQYIFPAEAKNVDAGFVKAGTRLAAVEMLHSGTTTFADMYYFEDQVAEAAVEAGIRTVAGESLIQFPAPDNKTIPDALAYTEKFLARWKGHPLVRAAVAPHSTYLLPPDALKSARALADKYDAPILIHASESQDEQRQVKEKYGKSPTQLLKDLGVLRKGVVLAHGVWLTPEDRAIIKETQAGVAHCPQSNMKLASGAAPVREMLADGLRLGLGTDGAASNNDLDMFEEMDAAAMLSKLVTNDPTSAPAQAVLDMATIGGARALGMEDEIGSLEVGKRADLIVVSTSAARLHPLYEPVSDLVYATKGADVRDAVVEGKIVMRDRKVLGLDEAKVIAEADRLKAQVVASLKK